jgi:DNA-binding IclR family transcriptional regulator
MTRHSWGPSERVLRCLPDFGSGESISASDISQRLGIPLTSVSKVLQRLVQGGEAVRLGVGRYVAAAKAVAP